MRFTESCSSARSSSPGIGDAPFNAIVGFLLVLLASLNVFGGYTVTERMLEMFRPKAPAAKPPADGGR